MNLEYYRIFYNVALNGNTTLTAQKLNISQPSVSRYITLLEKESNKKLFIRSKQGMKLTPEGHILFNYISKGMEYIQKAEGKVSLCINKTHNWIFSTGNCFAEIRACGYGYNSRTD